LGGQELHCDLSQVFSGFFVEAVAAAADAFVGRVQALLLLFQFFPERVDFRVLLRVEVRRVDRVVAEVEQNPRPSALLPAFRRVAELLFGARTVAARRCTEAVFQKPR
jgi:hypothetical protein